MTLTPSVGSVSSAAFLALATPSALRRIASVKEERATKMQRRGGGGGGGSGGDRVWRSWPIAQEGEGECALHLRLPLAQLTQSAAGATLQLDFDPGDVTFSTESVVASP